MSGYADTSFLASLYLSEPNSIEAADRMQRLQLPLLLTTLSELELVNALQLRLFRRELNTAQSRSAYAAFRGDLNAGIFTIEPVPQTIYADSIRLASIWTRKLGSRTLDIIHVAAALRLKADSFHTFDTHQKNLARAVGLQTY